MSTYNAKGRKKIGTWSKLVALCTKSMGGYYRSNGTVVRNISAGRSSDEDDESIFVETNVEFASITERTHARIRHQETQRQENIEAILSIVSSLIGEKVTIQSVDPDWASIFFHYAQDVNNKNMQSLWARAMLCELQHPSSISKRSLNFLYHCDLWEITAFKKVANYAFIGGNGHPFIFRTKKDLNQKDDIFTETRLLSHCINAGMISADPRELVVGFHFTYNQKTHHVAHEAGSFGQAVGFYQQSFTKTGSDIMKLLGGLESIPSSNMHRTLVWDYLNDFIDIETEGEQEIEEALVG